MGEGRHTDKRGGREGGRDKGRGRSRGTGAERKTSKQRRPVAETFRDRRDREQMESEEGRERVKQKQERNKTTENQGREKQTTKEIKEGERQGVVLVVQMWDAMVWMRSFYRLMCLNTWP